MKLRRPCSHGHYEEHPCIDGKWVSQARMMKLRPEERPLLTLCLGGEFLADDTLIIELTPEGLHEGFAKLVELGVGEFHDCAKYTEHSLVLRASDNARLKCEWVLPDALSVRDDSA